MGFLSWLWTSFHPPRRWPRKFQNFPLGQAGRGPRGSLGGEVLAPSPSLWGEVPQQQPPYAIRIP